MIQREKEREIDKTERGGKERGRKERVRERERDREEKGGEEGNERFTMQYDIHQRRALQGNLSDPRGVNFPQL